MKQQEVVHETPKDDAQTHQESPVTEGKQKKERKNRENQKVQKVYRVKSESKEETGPADSKNAPTATETEATHSP